MDVTTEIEPTAMKNPTAVERKSEREMVITRTFNGPARLVFEAWTKPELFKRWWVPKSAGLKLLSCEMDVRVGGGYRLEFDVSAPKPLAFFGRYLEVTPHSRLVWTNDEGGEGGAVSTVTLEEKGGKTLLVMHELHASRKRSTLLSGLTTGWARRSSNWTSFSSPWARASDSHEVVDGVPWRRARAAAAPSRPVPSWNA